MNNDQNCKELADADGLVDSQVRYLLPQCYDHNEHLDDFGGNSVGCEKDQLRGYSDRKSCFGARKKYIRGSVAGIALGSIKVGHNNIMLFNLQSEMSNEMYNIIVRVTDEIYEESSSEVNFQFFCCIMDMISKVSWSFNLQGLKGYGDPIWLVFRNKKEISHHDIAKDILIHLKKLHYVPLTAYLGLIMCLLWNIIATTNLTIDLIKPGSRKPSKRSEFEVTTMKVLEKANFRHIMSDKAHRKIAREIKIGRAFKLMPFTSRGQDTSSLDCTDCEWFGCLNAYKGQYCRRDHGLNQLILLEITASQDLWILHPFFGVSEANNDINVIHQLPLFNNLIDGKAPELSFMANGVTYKWGYYLFDMIYREWVTLVNSISYLGDDDHKLIRYKPRVTTTVFSATTPGNTLFAYRTCTSTDPTPMISPAFVEANYEILESLLRDRRRQIRNENLRTKLEYFSEDYDEKREMEPRPERTREVTSPLRTRSPRVHRQRKKVVGFEEASNREGSRTGRSTKVHLGRNEKGKPLQSSLTSVHGGRQSLINIRGNILPNGMLLSHHAPPFIPSSAHVPSGFVHTHANPNSQPFADIINGKTPSFPFQAQTGSIFSYKDLRQSFDHTLASKRGSRRRTWQFKTSNKEKARVSELSSLDLASTYKGLMEKTHTWIEAREVATNGAPNDLRDGFESLSKSPREILATEKVARSFEQPPRMLGSRRSRNMSKYCYFHKDHGHDTNDYRQLRSQIKEAPFIQATKVDSQVPLVGFSGEKSWAIGEVLLEITIGNIPFSRKEDEDKTTFFTREGVYCYRKLPFGLKNATATYQRLVDKVFNDQSGRNPKAYIEDMVIKSTSEEDMLTDIKETFQRFVLASFSPSAGEAIALSAEGTPVVVASDAFYTRVGSSFSSVGKQLAKSYEAKSLDSSGFREVTRTLSSKTKVSGPEPLTLKFKLILEMEEGLKESGVKKADLVSFKIFAKSSSFTFHEMSSAPDSLFALEVVWPVFNLSPTYLILSTRTLGLDPASKKGFGLSGMSRVTGSSLGVMLGDDDW
nr:hypothetical protein [Tanacetum cinerariifolium]